ncbi:MAG: CdaR family protein [Lachnospiraceae bacterium]|nr:CdaR family protein [Lachnospiraceae bacterium]
MKHKWTGNLSLKLLSLVVAFLIWLLVVNTDNPVQSKLFQVEIQLMNEDSVTEIDKVFDVVSDMTVVLKVTERRRVINSLSRDDFTVIADMENLNEMDSVPLTVTCSNSAVTWDEIEVSPPSMKVRLEQRKQSEFVVNISQGGEPADGYEVGNTEVVQGKTVLIAGPESTINRINQVMADIKVNNISSDQRLTAPLRIIDKDGVDFTAAQMSRLQIKDSDGVLLSENAVMVDVSLWKVKNSVPLEVEVTGTPADGYRFAGITMVPSAVNLAGTDRALAVLGDNLILKEAISVEGATEDFTQDFDLTELLEGIEEIRLAKDSSPSVTVSVKIEKTGDHTIMLPLSNLGIVNRPENMSLTFSPADEIAVIIRADNESDIIQLSDVKGSIDLAVCAEPGTYEIPVQIELPEGYELVSDVKLVVTAAEQPQENKTEDAGE